jgi:hypothetical protein
VHPLLIDAIVYLEQYLARLNDDRQKRSRAAKRPRAESENPGRFKKGAGTDRRWLAFALLQVVAQRRLLHRQGGLGLVHPLLIDAIVYLEQAALQNARAQNLKIQADLKRVQELTADGSLSIRELQRIAIDDGRFEILARHLQRRFRLFNIRCPLGGARTGAD